MYRTTEGWIEKFKEKGAFWLHDGNPKRPHAFLTSGIHSNGFVNSEFVMEDPCLLDEASRDLVSLLPLEWPIFKNIKRVVGPAMGATTLAHDVSRHIALMCANTCLRAYTERVTDGERKIMVFRRAAIRPAETILLVEDVLTTGESVELISTAVVAAGGYVMPVVATLVNRSGRKRVDSKEIVALIDRPMPMWVPERCPLCREGSVALRPKDKDNWARLNATY